MDYDLGYFDDETCPLEAIDNPFGPNCYPCLRNEVLPMSSEWTEEKVVSPLGIEPRTNRLRVCCSAN